MREYGAPHIGQHTLANLVHQCRAKIAAGGKNQRDQRGADHGPVKQGRILPAKPLINEIGQSAAHGQQRPGHHQQRHNRAGDAPAMRVKIRPEHTQQGGRRGGGTAIWRRSCARAFRGRPAAVHSCAVSCHALPPVCRAGAPIGACLPWWLGIYHRL